VGVDSEEIVAVSVRRPRAVDTKDWPRLGTCSTDDATRDDGATSLAYVHAATVLGSRPDDWIDTVGTYRGRLRGSARGWRIPHRTFRTTRTLLGPSLTPGSRRPTDLPEASP
jgi:hypothetical protein